MRRPGWARSSRAQVVHIDFNIPVALATLANPLSGFELNQFVQLELKNPVGCTVKVGSRGLCRKARMCPPCWQQSCAFAGGATTPRPVSSEPTGDGVDR
eukprot:scaffold61285_cov30-Tisochrysis_lutea.AAC.4